jgi:hypothetical protein
MTAPNPYAIQPGWLDGVYVRPDSRYCGAVLVDEAFGGRR